MKKRLISVLLCVMMIASLFSGLSVSAYADSTYETISYTIKDGDTLLKICQNNGLNWYDCEAAINKLNNLTSAKYRYLSVGTTIKLPASNADAAKVMAATTTTVTTVATTTNGVTNTVTTTSTSSGSSTSSSASYWLIPYTMQKGDTVAAVCNSLGVSFDQYKTQIQAINGITAWNKVSSGKTIYLPTTTAPASGTSCYAVMSHSVTKGETVTSICSDYGTSYAATQSLVKGLNSTTNLNNIKAGSTLLVAVPTVITATTTSSSTVSTVVAGTTSSSASSSTTASSTTSGTTSSSSSASNSYTISTGTITDGSVSFTVNGKTVTSAAAGAKVYIVVSPGSYKALKSLTVKASDGSSLAVTDGYFTMPSKNVTVDATFSAGRYIGVVSSNGAVSLTLNGVNVQHAVKGAKVKVEVTPNAGYEISGISVIDASSGAVVAGDVTNGGTFTMPDATVYVKVTYKTSAEYSLIKDNDSKDLNGSYKLTVNGVEVSKSISGVQVLVDYDPADGYVVNNIKVVGKTSHKEVNLVNNYFTMPTEDVIVYVTFRLADSEVFSIKYGTSLYGWFNSASNDITATTNKKLIYSSTAGKKVYIDLTPVDGYYPVSYTVTANGETKTFTYSTKSSENYFIMPSGDVTITPQFKVYQTELLWVGSNDSTIGEITVSTNGKTLNVGDSVDVFANIAVNVKMLKDGYSVKSIELTPIKSNGDEITSDDNKYATIDLPETIPASCADGFTYIVMDEQGGESTVKDPNHLADGFRIYVTYVANEITFNGVDADSNVDGAWFVRQSDGNNILEKGATVYTNEPVRFSATAKTGYEISSITLQYVDLNGKTQTMDASYEFNMPACKSFKFIVKTTASERTMVVNTPWANVISVKVGSAAAQTLTKTGDNEITVKTGDKVVISSVNGGGAFATTVEADSETVDATASNSNKTYTFTVPAVKENTTKVSVKLAAASTSTASSGSTGSNSGGTTSGTTQGSVVITNPQGKDFYYTVNGGENITIPGTTDSNNPTKTTITATEGQKIVITAGTANFFTVRGDITQYSEEEGVLEFNMIGEGKSGTVYIDAEG